MGSIDFRLLSSCEQLDILYEEGVYLSKRKSGPYSVVLYQLESLYVEVFYIKYRQYVSRIHCFESTTSLEPYLAQISLVDLLNELKA